jgi:hypothetical protein
MLERHIDTCVAGELRKGAWYEPAPYPVAIEPPYLPLRSIQDLQGVEPQSPWVPEQPPGEDNRIRLRIWISPEQKVGWDLTESFVQQLQIVRHRIGFEVIGNEEQATLWLTAHRSDLPVLQTAFESTFDRCKLRTVEEDPLVLIPPGQWSAARFYDYFAPSVYSKRLTQPEQLFIPPLASILTATRNIPSPAVGLYQVVFQPVSPDHNWGRNIAALHDYEFVVRFPKNIYPFLRSSQQIPSDDEKALAEALRTKAHNDKNIFALALRLAVIGFHPEAAAMLHSMAAFSGLVQHGGRPLEWCTEATYRSLTPARLGEMFRLCLTYRPGFLANSAELTSLVHIPPPEVLERHPNVSAVLEHLIPNDDLAEGSYVGDCDYAGDLRPVCIPLKARPLGVHIIGKPGKGKTEVLKGIILEDIRRGDGALVIDPHGDLIDDLLDLVPEEHEDRTILLDWSDPKWVPLFNPLADVRPADRGRRADNIVAAFKDVSEAWGHRAEHILRSLLHGVLHLPVASLLDVAHALNPTDELGKATCSQVLQLAEDPLLRRFWKTDLQKYANTDRAPVRHKLGLLLDIPPVSWTFMQPNSAVNLKQAMEEKKIILANLAGLGKDSQGTVGSLILSLLQVETLERSRQSRELRKPFHIHIDEAYLFQTDALDNILMQCRKYGVSVSLCHQYLRQYRPAQVDALASVGSTIIFNIDTSDAQKLCNSLQEKVTFNDIVAMKPYEAIARIDTEIVHIKTRQVPPPTHPSGRQRIIDSSHSRYYRTADEVLREINRPNRRGDQPFTPLVSPAVEGQAAAIGFVYDEF